MGVPGWPEFAAWTASIESVRIVLMLRVSRSAVPLIEASPGTMRAPGGWAAGRDRTIVTDFREIARSRPGGSPPDSAIAGAPIHYGRSHAECQHDRGQRGRPECETGPDRLGQPGSRGLGDVRLCPGDGRIRRPRPARRRDPQDRDPTPPRREP